MADLTTGPAQPEEPETDTRADSSEGPHRPFCPSLSRIININGHREEEAEEPQEEAAPEPYITGKCYLTDNHLTIWELLKLFFTDTTEPAKPEKKALEDISEKAKQIAEPMAEVLRQAADFGSRFKAFTEEVTERSAAFLEEYQQIKAKLEACDLIPPEEALELMGISELRALVSDKGIQGIRPPYYCLPIDKVSYVLFGGSRKGPFPIGQKASIDLGDERIKVRINDKQSLTMPALTAQDKHIYSAVTSLTQAGNNKILYSDIYQVLSGRETGRKEIPQAAVQQIDTSLEKFTRLFEAWEGDRLILREPLLFFVARDEPAGGHLVRTITVTREPVLWRLAFVRKQITRIKMDFLRIGEYRTSDLRQYLIERIERIRNGAEKNGRSIRLDTLCAVLGAKTPKQKRALRENAEKFLEFWKKAKFISGYRRNKPPKSKTIIGWEIIK